MAKVKGPIVQSGEASGSVAATTFGRSRGYNYARIRASVTNPKTPDQLLSRQVLRMTGVQQNKISTGLIGKPDGATQTPLEFYKENRNTGEVWSNPFIQKGLPGGKEAYSSDLTDYNALTDPEQTAWEAWNDALQSPFEDIPPVDDSLDEIPGVVAAFVICRMFYRSGYLSTEPEGAPPTWDNTPAVNIAKMRMDEKKQNRRLLRERAESNLRSIIQRRNARKNGKAENGGSADLPESPNKPNGKSRK